MVPYLVKALIAIHDFTRQFSFPILLGQEPTGSGSTPLRAFFQAFSFGYKLIRFPYEPSTYTTTWASKLFSLNLANQYL